MEHIRFSSSLSLQKPRKDHEEKQLVKEGRNSLIAFPNASSFSVFSHVRHFVLQSQLCETYNSRLGLLRGQEEGGGESGDEEEESKKEDGGKMPVVCVSLLNGRIHKNALSSDLCVVGVLWLTILCYCIAFAP